MSNPKPRRQCAKCPWKVDVDPRDIPGEYSVKKHRKLATTIADPGSFRYVGGSLSSMACHETPPGSELPCVGWLVHQLGVGNNIALRLRVISGSVDANVETVGPQHERFDNTLPRRRTRRAS